MTTLIPKFDLKNGGSIPTGAVNRPINQKLAELVSVKDFGALGDGITDDVTAIQNAIASLATTGGEVYFPSGTYLMSSSLTPISNVSLKGAGIDATIIKNTGTGVSPANITLTCFGTLTGNWTTGQTTTATTYAINTPVETQPNVTLTTAGNAGNFTVGGYAMLSGPTHSTNFWYPTWVGQIAAVDATTGIVTFNENLPLGGANWTLIQKVLVLPQNIKVSNMTIVGTGNEAVQFSVTKNIILENLSIVAGTAGLSGCTFSPAASRNVTVQNCIFNGNYVEVLGCFDSKIINNSFNGGSLVFDGGTQDSIIKGNIINNPTQIGVGTDGISIVTESNRNIIDSNYVINVYPNYAAIKVEGVSLNEGNNIISNNIITGKDVSTTYGIAINTSNYNTVIGNLLSSFYKGIHIVNSSVHQSVTGNTFNNITIPYDLDTTSSIQAPFTSTTWPTITLGSTNPDVSNGNYYGCYQSSPTSVTTFTGGKSGQILVIYFNTANTTLVASGNLHLLNSINYTPPAGTMMQFVYDGSTWRELSRSQNN